MDVGKTQKLKNGDLVTSQVAKQKTNELRCYK